MIKQKALIGMELDTQTVSIEAGFLKRLERAIHEPNPFTKGFSKEDILGKIRFDYLPPFFLGSLLRLPIIYKILDLNIKYVLLSRESIISHDFIKIGDTVKISTYLKDAYEQQGTSNPLGFIILNTLGYTQGGLSFVAEKIFAIRGGFNRRGSR